MSVPLSTSPRPLRDALRAALAIVAALAACPADSAFAQAGGESQVMEAQDLRCVIDDRWVGGQRGGYWPIRGGVGKPRSAAGRQGGVHPV